MRFLLLLALCCGALLGQEPPRDLVKRVAESGSSFTEELGNYTYRQHFRFTELDKRGTPRGHYQEVRDILYTPEGERFEEFVKGPVDRLRNIKLTDEDFRDLRDLQPFVLTADTLWNYQVRYKGVEPVRGEDCFAYRITPRQVLEGMRMLDGMMWVSVEHGQVTQVTGRPLPQIYHNGEENLFPQFTTIYAPVDGKYWFPVKTIAADALPFKTGPMNVQYEIEFENYRRFGADSTITFGEAVADDTP